MSEGECSSFPINIQFLKFLLKLPLLKLPLLPPLRRSAAPVVVAVREDVLAVVWRSPRNGCL